MTVRCFGILLLLSGFALGCGDDDDDDNIVTPVPIAGSGTQDGDGDGDGDGMDGERVVELVATEFRFTPDRIVAEPGETLVVSLRNAGVDMHSLQFELPDGKLLFGEELAPGETAALTVDAPGEAGDYTFFCPVSGHRQLGMVGTLVVQ